MKKMLTLTAKQKLALKSWFHALFATEGYALGNFLLTNHASFTSATFFKAAGYALLAPLTRALATEYSALAVKYPWLKPIAYRIAKKLGAAK